MIRVAINRHWRVTADAEVHLPLSASRVALEMRHLSRFVTLDLFHARLVADRVDADGEPVKGSDLRIEHRFCGFTITRQGRLLWRDPDHGFGFTDLSLRRPRQRFPHSCHYRLTSQGDGGCVVHVALRGRWTMRWLSRPLARAYIFTVLALSGHAIRAHGLRLASWHQQNLATQEASIHKNADAIV